MESTKIERIKKLSDEVNELHPLLSNLFSKIPNINHIEYTQGPTEMGADFILKKTDEIMGMTSFIGVIVKVGKIKQDHREIERQIEECGVERKVEGGKRKIYLNEIWIITNDTISDGAERKIYENYKNRNISFFDGTKLSHLIERFYPEYWTDISLSLGEYLRETKNLAESLIKSSTLIDTNTPQIRIDQKLYKLDSRVVPDKGRTRRPTLHSIENIIEKESFILIEGLMGTGKSTLIHKVISKYASAESLALDKTIPIGITFKDYYKDYKDNPEELIEDAILSSKVNKADYKFLVIIDGLDEVKIDSEERTEVITKLTTKYRELDNIKLLLTSRNIEEPQEKITLSKHLSRYQISALTIAQVISLVEAICGNTTVRTKLQNGIGRSHLFKTLPRTPISALLLAKILKEDYAELPSTMTELYSKYMELVLGRWDERKGLQSQKEYEIIDNVTSNLGYYIIDNDLQALSAKEAENFFKDYIKERNIKINAQDVFEKFLSKKEVIQYNNSTLTIQFKHRTFAEYFHAKKMLRDQLAVIDENIYELYWSTPYFFYIGLLKDCPNLIDQLNLIKITNDSLRFSKIVTNGNYLLAGYLTPYSYISEGVKSSFFEAAEIISSTIENKNTYLASLSKMQLLYLITHCLINSFGYEYFQTSL